VESDAAEEDLYRSAYAGFADGSTSASGAGTPAPDSTAVVADPDAAPPAEDADPDNPYLPVGGHPRAPLRVGGFGSEHIGGANFAYGDGSVRYLHDGMNKELLAALANRGDGEVVESSTW
jgi:prepilin-type processing-associated H-X9-DG protein